MLKRSIAFMATLAFSAIAPTLHAWDHPGHMITAAIAFFEIERARPELIEKLGLLFLKHPDPAPFWVAAGEAKGKERVRRMFDLGADPGAIAEHLREPVARAPWIGE